MKTLPGYSEAQLVTNRAAVLLFGASETDRRNFSPMSYAVLATRILLFPRN